MVDKKPDLGKNPFEAEIAANTAASTTFTALSAKSNPRDLNSQWFQDQEAAAVQGIAKIPNLPGSMEVRFSPLVTATNKSPRDLLTAVELSEIRTFGWPIGVTLQNRPEYRPRPSEYGIKAEVAIFESTMNACSHARNRQALPCARDVPGPFGIACNALIMLASPSRRLAHEKPVKVCLRSLRSD